MSGTYPKTAALGHGALGHGWRFQLRAGGAVLRKQPSLVPTPIGILPHPQPLHTMASTASRKRNDFDLRSGDAQPRSLFAMDGSFARDVLETGSMQ